MVLCSLDDFDDKRHCVPQIETENKKMASSIRCYFSKEPQTTPSMNNTQRLHKGLDLREDPLGYYIQLDYIETSQIEPPKAGVIFYTCSDSHQLSNMAGNTRISGEYRLGNASCVCAEPTGTAGGTSPHQKYHQILRGESSSWEDLRTLVQRIKVGTIRPTLSYQNPQVKPLPIQFRDWLIMGWKIVKRDVLRFKAVF